MPRLRLLAALAAFAAISIVFARPAHAAWPHDASTNVPVCVAANEQTNPTSVSDGAGGAIVTWMDNRSGTYDIYAQRISAAGIPLWTTNGVALCTAAGDQSYPTIISDGAGGAIVTWRDYRSGVFFHIYAQRISAAGTPQWTANGVGLCTAVGNQYSPTITSDGAGGAIVTWNDLRGATYDIYAQRISAAGTPQWTADGVALCTATGDQVFPTITSDGTGGAIVTWYDSRGANYDIYAQRISAAGTPQWTANGVALCTAVGNQYSPTITSDGAGGAIVTWYDVRVVSYDIYAQHISATGTLQWSANGVALCTAVGNQISPTITSDGTGGAIVTWYDARGANYDIYAQRISAAGTLQWTADGAALCTAASDQIYPTITSDGTGGAIVTWMDYRSGAYDIYAQRISAAGTLQWTIDGAALCTAMGSQANPTITSDGGGGAIVTWQDSRSFTGTDIYSQRVDAFGYLAAEPTLASVRDVPFDQGSMVKVSWQGSYLDALSDPNMTVYDVLRSVPGSIAANRLRRGGTLAASLQQMKADGDLIALAMNGQVYYWERVTSLSALHYISTYSYIGTTLQDSVSANNPKTAFMVVARNSANSMFWLSQPDSGYSVDNLPPAAPAPFTGQYSAGSAKLHWNRNTEADLAGYKLYRGSNAAFVPGAGNLVSTLADTGYIDAAAAPYIYKLMAVDSHGNESPVATLTPTGTLGVGDGAALQLAFAPPSPNPARGSTMLEFTLPQAGHVRLSVFDAAGRRAQTLRDAETAAGSHREAFALHDEAGRELAAGLYLVRLETAGHVITRRLAVVR